MKNLKTRSLIAIMTLGLSLITAFTVCAANNLITYVRLESTYEIEQGKVNVSGYSISSYSRDYDMSFTPNFDVASYSLGDPIPITVVLTATGDKSFSGIKVGSCKLDGKTASDLNISDDGKSLTLKFTADAIGYKLNNPTNLVLDKKGKASWDAVENATSYKVVLEKINDYGKSEYIKEYKTEGPWVDMRGSMYSGAADYVFTVTAQNNKFSYIKDSSTVELPFENSVLLKTEDLGLTNVYWRDDGTCIYEGEILTNQIVMIKGITYSFNEEGQLNRGWLNKEDKWYFFNDETGAMEYGYKEINGKTYYLNPESGIMATGITEIEDKKIIFDPVEGGRCKGFVWVNGNWYYALDSGEMNTEQLLDPNMRAYLFREDGTYVK